MRRRQATRRAAFLTILAAISGALAVGAAYADLYPLARVCAAVCWVTWCPALIQWKLLGRS